MDDNHNMGGMSMDNKQNKKMTMMHMSFYMGDQAEILFSGWPGNNTVMYVLSLLLVFVLAFLVECISRSNLVENRVKNVNENKVVSGLLRTVVHALRMSLAYLVMLAVMSFNVGVFISVVLGHALGFFVFGSRVFGSGHSDGKQSDLEPLSC